jgi:hypothetical protein
MAQIKWGSWSAASWGLCVLTAFAVMGCGSSDGSSSTNNCGTILSPKEFTVIDVQPAAGSSVPNSNIVHTFTIKGQVIETTMNLGMSAAHTAGDPMPALSFSFSASASGNDSVYTAAPVMWAMPGHVELNEGGVETNAASNCVSVLPNPLFSYDVTAP